ncbi:nuclear pore complex protein Nup160-like isoform X2 [Ranitomeya variabilis]|uniref:nuclear pore complex protein Nup160-like isoform X2 n=1 Tax=Ranitomeya variabilis TaxID=490064 RepID=UPI0040562E80
MEGAQPHSGARISGDAQFPHFCRRAFRSAHLCLSARISNVLHLLERVDLPELLIQLATLAISETVDDLKSQATLRTRIFKHHLDFGHNRQSYNAVAHIPDHSRIFYQAAMIIM